MESDCWKRIWITFTFTSVFLLLIHLSPTECISAVTANLSRKLFNEDYRQELVPICTLGANVHLEFDLALRQIISLEEKAQVLQTNTWIRMRWPDCRLTWNASDYGGLDVMVVPYETVWSPDLTLYDSSAEEEMMPGRDQYRASVNSSGNVTYNFPTVLTSICRIKVTYFPFDTQNCSLKFGSWSHDLRDIDIHVRHAVGTKGDLSNFVPNNEWEIVELTAVRHVVPYTELQTYFPDVTYSIVMKRRPQFYVMTMLFPCILVSAIATIGFLLPAESGEKVSLEVTVLLSLAVFLLVISDFLPPSAEEFPIIGTYFAVAMGLVSVSLVLSVLVLNVHHRGENGKKVPGWVRALFLDKIGQMCRPRKKRAYTTDRRLENGQCNRCSTMSTFRKLEMSDGLDQNAGHNHAGRGMQTNLQDTLQSDFERTVSEQSEYLQKIVEYLEDKKTGNQLCNEWRSLARILDRLLLAIYVVTSVIVTLAFLLPLSAQENQ